jgi:beta-mannosidase
MDTFQLGSGWQLKERASDRALTDDFAEPGGWLPASVPGVVQLDLLAAGRIPDPFYGLNENEVQWVGERDWLYRCTFEVSAETLGREHLDLCFDGLDTFATVWLNGHPILTSDNMFVPQRVAVKDRLRAGQNELRLLFESAVRRGHELQAQHGGRPAWNGDSSRMYVRKAQYHYGWDWGPTLMTAGPWRAVRLEAYSARLSELDAPVELSEDLHTATVWASVRAAGAREGDNVRLELLDPSGQRVAMAVAPVAHTPSAGARADHVFLFGDPQLWWPNGYGPQPLYRLAATLERDGQALDQAEQRIGLRRLRLVQEPLAGEPGTSFLFEVNNTPIFCGGANWIPADSFTPRLTRERYGQLLRLAADANMTMLRVWGGGIYEDDVFYDWCDELGLLVWQDFMFACGMYPAYPKFVASVKNEAEANVRRLRHHPSLAIWVGNNEDYQIANSLGVYNVNFDGDHRRSKFPARYLYEHVLPEVVTALDPRRPYWRGSPYGGPDANSRTEGDRHTWDIWHGMVAPYQEYPNYSGRFVSEFGMLSFPALSTVEAFTPPDERYPQSRTLEHHNKASGGVRRAAAYISDNIRYPVTLADHIYASQFIQAEAIAYAYSGWRRCWGGPGRYAVAGALVWQLEDCWPVSSWAVVDWNLRLKPGYFVARRQLAPLAVGLARASGGAAVWAVNGRRFGVAARLELSAWTLQGELAASELRAVQLPANQSTELDLFPLPSDQPLVLGARLWSDDQVAARATLWPEPFKYLRLPDPGIEVERNGESLVLRAARPAKGVWLEAGDQVSWSDNFLDLLPGDDYLVTAAGLGDEALRLSWLGKERSE